MMAVLLVATPVLLLLMAGSAYVLLRTSEAEKQVAARIEQVTLATRPRAALALPSITRKDLEAKPGLAETVTGIFGFSIARKDQFTMAWQLVVGIAAVLGYVAKMLAAGLLGDIAWLALPVVTVVLSRAIFNNMRQNRVRLLRAQLPDALGLIVRAVRVGVPVTEALRAVCRESPAPTSVEFDRLADQISIGSPMETALREMAARNDLPEYGFFAAALGLQAQTGGGLSETLELLADVTRKRVAMQARGHALSAEARTSSMILGGLPIVAGLGMYFVNPDYAAILVVDETGRMVLGAAVLSLATGMFVMRQIIRASLS